MAHLKVLGDAARGALLLLFTLQPRRIVNRLLAGRLELEREVGEGLCHLCLKKAFTINSFD